LVNFRQARELQAWRKAREASCAGGASPGCCFAVIYFSCAAASVPTAAGIRSGRPGFRRPAYFVHPHMQDLCERLPCCLDSSPSPRSAARRFPTNMIFLRLRSSFRIHCGHPCFTRGDPALDRARIDSCIARLSAAALLRPAHDLADVCRYRRLAAFHLRLRRRLPPKAGAPRSSSSRCSMFCNRLPDPWVSVVHGDLLSRAFPRLNSWAPNARAVFAIFTSQAWNMAFSFYQVAPQRARDLVEVARGFGLSWWQAVLAA